MPLDWILASLPIALILGSMVILHWGAAKAGSAAWMMTMIIAYAYFGTDLEVVALSHVKAILVTADVLMIVWGAYLLFRVAYEAGAIEDLGRALPHLTGDRGMQALLIGWAFPSFLQGVGGFGVPTAITAPLLTGMGFSPLVAVVIPSLGHAWSVTFGSLGSSFQALMAASSFSGDSLAAPAATVLGLVGLACGVAVVHFIQDWTGVRRLILPLLAMGAAMGGVQYLMATHHLWNLAGLGGGLAGLAVGLILSGRYRGDGHALQALGELNWTRVLLALVGYGILVSLSLVIRLAKPLPDLVGPFTLKVRFAEITTSRGFVTPAGYGRQIPLASHAGSILVFASLASYTVYRSMGRYSPRAGGRVLADTVRRIIPTSLGVASLVATAMVMSHSGMTEALAQGVASAFGPLFPLATPWLGAIGAFTTGSNTNSNVIFTLLQERTAQRLGYSPAWILAGQTAGGAIGSIIAPSKIIVATGVIAVHKIEGLALRAMISYVLLLLALTSLLVWAAVAAPL